jgi:RNA polymerase sigma factor (sigma-70 family)
MASAPLGAVVRYLRTAGPANPEQDLTDAQLLERFVASRDEAAFTALVRRHGPMVLGVCRQVLRHPQDAEDAFQVTFLVLARHAATVRKREALAGWLHGVAYRTALQARRTAARRRHHETRAEAMSPKHPSSNDLAWQDVQSALQDEIRRLSPTYRAPFVLCCLEGRSRAEAAAELGLTDGTLSSRVARARKRLQARLARRGISLAVALGAIALTQEARAALPRPLLRTTVAAALCYAADTRSAAGLLSPSAAALLKGVSRTMLLPNSRAALLLLAFAAAVAASGGALLFRLPAAEPPTTAANATSPAAAVPADDAAKMTVAGRVVGADSKPVADAAVALVARPKRQYRSGDWAADRPQLLGRGRTDAAGRFSFPATRTSSARFWEVHLLAAAQGHGVAWKRVGADVERPEVVLHSPPEQIVRGRLVDLLGQPAARVRVSVSSLGEMIDGTWQGVSLAALPKEAPWPTATTTDEQGRFEVRGCNRDGCLSLHVADDHFAVQSFQVTPPGRPRPESRVLGYDAGGYLHTQETGADEKGQAVEPTFILAPAQVLEGRVVYGDTRQPVAGASVQGVLTDAAGRFRLRLGAETGVTLIAVAPAGEPYLSAGHRPREGEPFGPRRRLLGGYDRIELTGADGSFAIALPPGKGYLLVQGPSPDYVHVALESNLIEGRRPGGSRLYPDAALAIDVPARGEPKEVALTLRRGATVRGRLLLPNGTPVPRALVLSRLHVYVDLGWHFASEMRGGVFELHGLDPEKQVPVYFLDPVNRCGAVVTLSGKQAGREMTVTLEPCGQATARYVDNHGKPLVGNQAAPDLVVTPGRSTFLGDDIKSGELRADQESLTNLDRDNYWDKVKTDAQGRVTFPALIPGATYRLGRFEKDHWTLHKEFRVEPGRTVDLGDVVIKKDE